MNQRVWVVTEWNWIQGNALPGYTLGGVFSTEDGAKERLRDRLADVVRAGFFHDDLWTKANPEQVRAVNKGKDVWVFKYKECEVA